MKKTFTPFFFIICFYPVALRAQSAIVTGKDSLKYRQTDTLLPQKAPLNAAAKMPGITTATSSLQTGLNGSSHQVKQFSYKLSHADSQLTKGLQKLIPQKIKADLSLENAVQYQPPISGLTGDPSQKFFNKFYIRGNILAWGIPLNLNFTNDQNSITGFSAVRNSLFKFDYNPNQLNGLLTSDLSQYYNVRKSALGGLDLTGYTQQVLKGKLKSQSSPVSEGDVISKYVSDPSNVTGLLELNDQQIREKLHAQVDQQSKLHSSRDSVHLPVALPSSGSPAITGNLTEKSAVSTVSGDAKVPSSATTGQNKDKLRTNAEIDSIARTITTLQQQLKAEGIDMHRMLLIQHEIDANHGDMTQTELANSYQSVRTQNGMQSLFTHVQALKIGSFGTNTPGATQQTDLFIEGTHFTYKAGTIPITLGYGAQNDIASAKDINYTSSDYNSPRNVTYASIKVNQGAAGNASFSVIGSTGNGGNNFNSSYTTPASPANNVALTISKYFKAGDLGKFTLDVSRSTTLNYSNITTESDAVLDRKSGLSYDQGNMIEALSFGVDHKLELPKEGLSENVYFNYSGSGYQNPGNNGVGGGGMKLGEHIKKSLFKNKLTLTVRSSLNDKSISYINNDQWRTYQVQLDSRYVINRKFNISLKYMDGGTDKQVDNVSSSVYSSQKYQVDGNATYKIGHNYTVSHLTIGKQDYTNTYLSATGSSLLMVNYTQSLLLKQNSLTASVFYNKELTSTNLIGNLMNSDLTYQYKLFSKVNLASGITYLDNAGTANQAGVRQSIGLLAGSNFNLDTNIDLRRNLITPLYPDLYPACRAQLSLKYHLKN